MFITENYSSKFTITSFWVPALKSFAENGILKKFLDMSLADTEKLARKSQGSDCIIFQLDLFLLISSK